MSRNNVKLMQRFQSSRSIQHWSLRKLSVGVASVLLGTTFYFGAGQVAHADTLNTGSVQSSQQISNQSNTGQSSNQVVLKSDQQNVASQNNQQGSAQSQQVNSSQNYVASSAQNDDSQVVADSGTENVNNVQSVAQNSEQGSSNVNVQSSLASLPLSQAQVSSESGSGNTQTLNVSSLISQSALPASQLGVSEVSTANGGYDQKTWGTLDISKWQFDSDNNITGYTGDTAHIIIPNSVDVGHDVRISAFEMRCLFNNNVSTLAISKTGGGKVITSDAGWSYEFSDAYNEHANHNISMDLSNLDTSNITDMSSMFYKSKLTNIGNLGNWNTSNVTNMSSMFQNASNLTNIGDLSHWQTGNVQYMDHMFTGASKLTNIGDIGNWNTSKVINMSYMFAFDSGIKLLNVSGWNFSSLSNDSYYDGFYNFCVDGPQLILANNLKHVPSWFNPKSDFIFDNGSVILTNNSQLLNLSSDKCPTDSIRYDLGNWRTRSIFYDSKSVTPSTRAEALSIVKPIVDSENATWLKQNESGYTISALSESDPVKYANGTFTLVPKKETQQYQFVDDDNNGANVGSVVSVTGNYGSSVDTKLTIPTNYDLASGQTLPTSVTLGDNNALVEIHLVHHLTQQRLVQGRTITAHFVYGGPNIATRLAGKQALPDQSATIYFVTTNNPWLDAVTGKYRMTKDATTEYTKDYLTNPDNFAITNPSLSWDYGFRYPADTPEAKSNVGDWSFDHSTNHLWLEHFDGHDDMSVADYLKSIGYQINSNSIGYSIQMPDWYYGNDSGDVYTKTTSKAQNQGGWYPVHTITLAPLSQTVTIHYLDDSTNKEVSYSTQTGYTDNTLTLSYQVPTNYIEDTGQNLPTTVTIKPNGQSDVTVKVKLAVESVTDNKTVTRTIKITDPVTSKVNTITQTAKLMRTGSKDLIHNTITWEAWTVKSNGWTKYTVPTVVGYVPSQLTVDAVNVNSSTKDTTVNITYSPIAQSVNINFVDYKTGSVISSTTVNGVTNSTMKVTDISVPDGYVLYDSEKVPSQIKFAAQNNQDCDIVIKPLLVFVPSTTGANSSQIIPGTKNKHYPENVTKSDLNKTVTRKIIVHNPDGSSHTYTQSVTFVRNAWVNAVNGSVIFGNWSYDGKYVFTEYTPQTFAGYYSKDGTIMGSGTRTVPSETVTPDSGNETVDVIYLRSKTMITLNYVDSFGKQVGTTTFNLDDYGHGEYLAIDTDEFPLPTGYQLVNAHSEQIKTPTNSGNYTYDIVVEKIPAKTYYYNSNNLPSGIPKSSLEHVVSRTIKIQLPNGRVRTIKQRVTFRRSAMIDSAGKITYSTWQPIGRSTFAKIFVPKRFGYSQQVSGGTTSLETVTADMADQTVTVKYVKNN